MHSLAKLGVVAVGLSLALSLAACAMTQGEETGSSESDLFRRGGPGNGRRPIGPIIAPDEDAAPPASILGAVESDAEAPPALDDAGAGIEADAEAPPAVDDDASAPSIEPDAG